MSPTNNDGNKQWETYRLYVTMGISKLEEQNQEILEKLNGLEKELAVHKVKSGFWGALMGALVALGTKFFTLGGGSH